MKEFNLKLPLLDSKLLYEIKVGDKVYLTGEIFVFRDRVHKKISNLEIEEISNIDFSNSAVYYCASTPKKGNFVIGSCGPTSSYRMDKYTENVLKLGFKIMIGKGYRSKQIIDLCSKYKAIYIITYGGCGAYLNKFVKSASVIAYEDLGTEAMYKFEVLNFPGFVAIDVHSNALWC